ncbi:MAG: factor-independent urate hydroxylase [Actinomycetes bacterium]
MATGTPAEGSTVSGAAPDTGLMGANRYGKDGIRLVLVRRRPEGHEVRDLTVDVRLEGDFARVHTVGDNAAVLPTDTMRATAYALAPEHLTGSIETFGLVLAHRFLGASPATSRATVWLAEHGWTPHAPAAFVGAGDERRTAEVSVSRDGDVAVTSGLAELTVLKTEGSAFSGFLVDEYTVLAETEDRLLATKVTARWTYRESPEDTDHDACHAAARQAMLDAFAGHRSASVQHTLYVMGRAVLDAVPAAAEVSFSLPNLHHVPADLSASGLTNELASGHAVFVATDRPYGVIEGTVTRSGTDGPPPDDPPPG